MVIIKIWIALIGFFVNSDFDPVSKDFVLGKFDYKEHPQFVLIEEEHSSKPIYLQKTTYKAFKKMYSDALEDNVKLKVVSGTRNFDEQKAIWERKWEKYKNLSPKERAKKILRYSSMPSSSRHHWGTDIDLNNFENSYFEYGEGLRIYKWLKENANNYGFYQVYTDAPDRIRGYNLERWHWSYMPLSCQYLGFYNKNVNIKDITGFKGSNLAEELLIIRKYVNGVDRMVSGYKCK